MKIERIVSDVSCTGCTACFAACPTGAIKMSPDGHGFYRPIIRAELCVSCNRCMNTCPQLKDRTVSSHSEAYACYAKEKETQLKSASGGVFFLLANEVLKQGGVVFGAGFDDSCTVKHFSAENLNELERLRGSKYVQSDLGNCFTDIQSWLRNGRFVLFSGTPCQIAGLIAFLGGAHERLLTVDLVCHGTPSNTIWQDYLRERFHRDKLCKVSFRYKTEKADYYPLRFETDRQIVTEKYEDNLFIRGFISNLYLKEACYHCRYKGIQRESDITIGDCWGIEKVQKEFPNGYGTSFVLTHSAKGRDAFRALGDKLNTIPIADNDLKTLIENNPCITRTVTKPERAAQFWEAYADQGFARTVKKLTRKPLSSYLKRAKYETKYHIYLLVKPLLNRGE